GAQPTTIDADFMTAAIELVQGYFWPHARAALRQIGLTERHINARRVLRWIRARDKREFSGEEVRRQALGQKLDAEQTAGLLGGLRGYGWARELEPDTTPRGGPPPRRGQATPPLSPAAKTAKPAQPPPRREVSAVSAVSASQSVFEIGAANGGDELDPADP